MNTKSSSIFSTALIAMLVMMVVAGCGGGGGNTFVATPTPVSVPTNFAITSVSPTTVDEGQTLEITYVGPAPGQSTNPVVATFQQGSLPSRQGQLISFDSLGNNTYNIFFKVPTGFASDRGIIPISSTVMLSNSQASSSAQNIAIAPPPTLVLFPEELYLGDTGVSVRIHGNGTHFDQTTSVTSSNGVQITNTALVSGDDLVITLNVTAAAATNATVTVSSGGSDPRKSEVVAAQLPVAALPSALIGASQLSVGDAPPGSIIHVQGLFNTPDGADHNTVQWSVAGQAVTVQPVSESSGALDVMVPLFPNSDGSIYSGLAQLLVRASGRTSQFTFTIDPLPTSPLPRGAVFTAMLDGFANSIPQLQSALSALNSSPDALNVFQAGTGSALGMVSQLRQFVAAEASGTPATPPGGKQPVSLQQFDLMEQLLVTSGLFGQVQQTALGILKAPEAAGASVVETAIVAATIACKAPSVVSKIINVIESTDLVFAMIAAASGNLPLAGLLLTAIPALDTLADISSFADAICSTFPISLTKVAFAFAPGALDFTSTLQRSPIDSISGSFAACISPLPLLAFDIEQAIENKFPIFKVLPDQLLIKKILDSASSFFAKFALETAIGLLTPELQKSLGVVLDIHTPPLDVSLTPATISLFSANPTVALPVVSSAAMSVQPTGPGATQIRGDLSKFKLLLNPTTTCDPTTNSLDIPGNAVQVTVQGPPLVIPTNSGGSTGIIPGTLGGKPIDKAYVAVPNAGIVSVLNADAPAGTPPITTIPMPVGFSPTATAANPFSSTVFVISYTSPNVVVIDATTDALAANTLTLPVVNIASFSGGNCIVCGIVADPIANQVIFDTADGYMVFDVRSNLIVQNFKVTTAENFGYNPLTRQILNSFYGAPFFSPVFGLDLLDLGTNTSLSFAGSVGSKPDAAAVDYTTNIGIVANEAETVPIGFITLINLNAKQTGTAAFSAPSSTFQFPDATGLCSGGGNQSEWTMLAVDPANHFLFVSNEFSDCAGVLDLPPLPSTGPPRTASQFRFGEMPISPDGFAWSNSGDPHGTAVFTSVIDGRSYGFLVRSDGHYVGRIDLQNLFNATVLAGTPGAVDMTTQVTYLATLP